MIHIINKHTSAPDRTHVSYYVGRPSPLGNPYIIGIDGTRAEVVALYEQWLRARLEEGDRDVSARIRQIMTNVQKGIEVDLICFCAPQACHADVIKKIVEEQLDT